MKYNALIFLIFCLFQLNNHASGQPNFVIFIADDAGMDFGCYGYEGATTPNIDKLAENGLKFTKAFLTAPQCSPSRTSMLSGQFAHTIGTEDLHIGLPDTVRILPSYLKEAGYFTGIMLKGHIGQHGMDQFDWYDNGFWPDYVQGRWNDKAIDNFNAFLDTAGNKPFFLWTAFVDPHREYQDSLNGAAEVTNPKKVTVPPFLKDSPKTREDLAHYYDEIARMDKQIGSMISSLEERNLLESTIIIFLSDNGMPFPRAKGTLYDSGIQTPLIFYWKDQITVGATYNGLVSTIDLAPTILNIAGVAKPDQMYGNSILEILGNQNIPGRKYVFGERNWHGTDEHMRCVRTEKYKFIINSYTWLPHGTPSDLSSSPSWYDLKVQQKKNKLTDAQSMLFVCPRPSVELYDLENDPFETNNLADQEEYQEIIKQFVKVMDNWKKETGDHPPFQRRRFDQVDRVTGAKLSNERYDYYDED